jgi:PKD repeat protein
MRKNIIGFFVLATFLFSGFSTAQATALPMPYYGSDPVISGVSGPQTLKVGQMGTWRISAYDQEESYLSYSVDWGERVIYTREVGSAMTMPVPQQTSTFSHTYNQAGNYTVTFTVVNGYGQSTQTSLSVNVKGNDVRPSSPIITGITGPKTVNMNHTATWKVKAKGINQSNLSYSVNWGDEIMYYGGELKSSSVMPSTSQTATFSHRYRWAGTYTARFTVTDENGQSVTKSFKIKVRDTNRYEDYYRSGSTSPSSGQ